MYTPPPDLRAKASATAQGGSNHEHHHRSRSLFDSFCIVLQRDLRNDDQRSFSTLADFPFPMQF
jgi:hypothetical protein